MNKCKAHHTPKELRDYHAKHAEVESCNTDLRCSGVFLHGGVVVGTEEFKCKSGRRILLSFRGGAAGEGSSCSRKGQTCLFRIAMSEHAVGWAGWWWVNVLPSKLRIAIVAVAVFVYLRWRKGARHTTNVEENTYDLEFPPISTPSGKLSGAKVRVAIVAGDGAAESGLDLVCIHGANSWGRGTWQRLADCARTRTTFHRILMIDLPGFGKSTLGELPARSEDVQHAYAEIIGSILERPSVIVAHSMGCVLSSSLVDHPLVKGVVWICPIGSMPTLGVLGAWWSLLFEYGFPHRQLQWLGPTLGKLVLAILGLVHEFGSLTERTATGYRAPQRLVGKTRHGRHFADPWLLKVVAKLQKAYMNKLPLPPIAFVSGAQDSLVPPHIAEMTHQTLERYCPTYRGKTTVIQSAGHSIHDYPPDQILAALQWVLRPTVSTLRTPTTTPLPSTPRSFPAVGYMTSFSPRHTQRVIASLYDEMGAMV